MFDNIVSVECIKCVELSKFTTLSLMHYAQHYAQYSIHYAKLNFILFLVRSIGILIGRKHIRRRKRKTLFLVIIIISPALSIFHWFMV